MDKRSILRFGLLPALVGLLATGAVYVWLVRGHAVRAQVMVPVVVAQATLPTRTVLSPKVLTIKEFPPPLVGPAALHKLADADGKTTTVPLAAGQVVFETDLARPGDKSGLSYHIPNGLSAVAVKVTEEQAVADLLQPGDHVDVVAATKDNATLALQGLLVLAVGQNQTGAGTANPQEVHTVTLAASPPEAVTLVAAEQKGPLRLLLLPAAEGGR